MKENTFENVCAFGEKCMVKSIQCSWKRGQEIPNMRFSLKKCKLINWREDHLKHRDAWGAAVLIGPRGESREQTEWELEMCWRGVKSPCSLKLLTEGH